MDSFNLSNSQKEELNKDKSKDLLGNIKNNFFLRIMFNNLQKNKFLELIKFNKIKQTILGLSINDYKNYSETFTPIEIEIKPIPNKFGKFINITNKEEESSHFHIYFNNDKKEIKKYNLTEDDNITKIKIIIDYQVISFNKLFEFCNCIESINFIKFNRNNINDMSNMFSYKFL